jgi:GxxExxY protein
MIIHEQLSEQIIAAAIEVHRHLGPGLLESAYEKCLCFELAQRGLVVKCQEPLPINYKGVQVDCGYRMDIVVDDKILLELKSVEQLAPIHTAQLMTYLKLSRLRVGLLINFNLELLTQGIARRVL